MFASAGNSGKLDTIQHSIDTGHAAPIKLRSYRLSPKKRAVVRDAITKMLEMGIKFEWTDACQTAFDQLKQALTELPVLAYPDFTKPFILCTDASYIDLGAVLEQCQDCEQQPQPIQYASASLMSAQKELRHHTARVFGRRQGHTQIQTLPNCDAA